MSRHSRREYLRRIYKRYHKAGKHLKTEILNEFIKVSGYHRKSALRLLNAAEPQAKKKKPNQRPHNKRYEESTMKIIESVWEAMGYPWSVSLKAALKEWLPQLRKRYRTDNRTEAQLLKISARQIDRRLKDKKRRIKRRFYGTTKPGYLLKSQIPIRVKSWDIRKAGYLEVDTVAHCGNSLSGDFLYTLNTVDIRTSWVERQAMLGKGEQGTCLALQTIRQRLPFALRGLDSDNGSEFINHHLWAYCKSQRLEFTRSRPQESKDQAHIEQKNFTHVRKLLGWQRYSSHAALQAINRLYAGPLRLLDNLFYPSVKLKSKKRLGSKIVRQYFAASSPLERLRHCLGSQHPQVLDLMRLRSKLDPFELIEQVDRAVERIHAMAQNRLPSSSIGQLAYRQRQDYFLTGKQIQQTRLLRGFKAA